MLFTPIFPSRARGVALSRLYAVGDLSDFCVFPTGGIPLVTIVLRSCIQMVQPFSPYVPRYDSPDTDTQDYPGHRPGPGAASTALYGVRYRSGCKILSLCSAGIRCSAAFGPRLLSAARRRIYRNLFLFLFESGFVFALWCTMVSLPAALNGIEKPPGYCPDGLLKFL